MRGWLAIERRFLDALLEGVMPGAMLGPERGDPRFWLEFERAAPPILRAGLRAAAWLLGAWLSRLPVEARGERLAALARSRSYLVRQLVLGAKLVACFAYFWDPAHEHPRTRPLEAR